MCLKHGQLTSHNNQGWEAGKFYHLKILSLVKLFYLVDENIIPVQDIGELIRRLVDLVEAMVVNVGHDQPRTVDAAEVGHGHAQVFHSAVLGNGDLQAQSS